MERLAPTVPVFSGGGWNEFRAVYRRCAAAALFVITIVGGRAAGAFAVGNCGAYGFSYDYPQAEARAIMLKGTTLPDLQIEALALVGLTLMAMVIAVTRFRRTLD